MSTSRASSTVFVAGATGFTGRGVVQAACAAGLRTVAHVRPDSARRAEWERRFAGWGAEPDSTPWEASAMAARVAALKPTYVFAVLGTTMKRAKQDGLSDGYAQVDYGMTAMLIDAAVQANKPRFIYLSAAGVAPNRGAYLEARYKVEQRLKASGLPYTIARPGLITGVRDEGRMLESMFAAALKPTAAVLRMLGSTSTAAWATPLTGEELGRALVHAALAQSGAAVVLEPKDILQASQASAPAH